MSEESSDNMMDYTDDVGDLCEEMEGLMDMSDVDELPTAVIVTNVPAAVFTDAHTKSVFEKLFLDLDTEASFVYLRNFKRVRIQFSSADTAGIARIKNDGIVMLDQTMRCFFFQLRTVASDDQHLKLPERTKMFLISPPASPPVGWESVPESEPVINYDLIHAIASLNPGETHEVHPPTVDAPAIVVHLCEDPVGFSPGMIAKQKIVQTRRPEARASTSSNISPTTSGQNPKRRVSFQEIENTTVKPNADTPKASEPSHNEEQQHISQSEDTPGEEEKEEEESSDRPVNNDNNLLS